MSYYETINSSLILCTLCPNQCKIKYGETGICGVRKNIGSSIKPLTYGIVSSYAVDPIEKKPLYHFFPTSRIFSIGSFGCNLRCDFCQNHIISRWRTNELLIDRTDPKKLVVNASNISNNIGVAFTYNEPVIWFEFMRDVAIEAHKKGLKTVMVSNGYVNEQPLMEMISFIDAFNIDLKAFNNSFYERIAHGKLSPVLRSLKLIAESGKHLEICTLIIPGENDSVNEMSEEAHWIANELGPSVALHINRYYPNCERHHAPTSKLLLEELASAASKWLDNVHIGNI